MKRHSSTILIAAIALIIAVPAAVAQGQELSLPGLGGTRLSEGELSKGTHIIVFWASWAPRGRDVVERVNGLTQRWGSLARVIMVNFQEDERTVRDFLRNKPDLKAQVFLDREGELSKKYRVNFAPWLLILKDGRIAFSDRLPADPHPVVAQILG